MISRVAVQAEPSHICLLATASTNRTAVLYRGVPARLDMQKNSPQEGVTARLCL